ncbi:DUF7848 domain-containing protein [Streptomyces otsuchiensis]|uniref:DUF7848 domain-containing protein n=1 Tax=Streptomyces otsuchiensis TaxID=2681388 RepID=UPI001031ACB3|nr:hypothetical protein [Streptomyces otsuchiensis]
MNQSYRFRRFTMEPDHGELIHRAQCVSCAQMGPQAPTGDAAMMWVVFHLEDHPSHVRYRELWSRPYRVVPRGEGA